MAEPKPEKIAKLQDLLSEYIGDDKVIVGTEISNLTAPGENYGSEMLKLDITLKDKNNDAEEVLHTVAKMIPTNEEFVKFFNVQTTFKGEIIFYKSIVPKLQAFQREFGIREVMDFFPKCYGARINLDGSDKVDENAVLILENLAVSGYANLDRYIGYDLVSAKLLLKDLAVLHSVPLAMKLKQPADFDKYIKRYCGAKLSLPEPGDMDQLYLDLIWEADNCVPIIPKIKRNFAVQKVFSASDVEGPFDTLIHDDLWVNNAMMKFQNGRPIGNKFVDFQLFGYKSPVRDLLLFLTTSVQTSVLKESFDDLLKYYHEHFRANLLKFGCDATPVEYSKFLQGLKTEAPLLFPVILFFIVLVVFGKKGGNLNDSFDYSDPTQMEALKRNIPLAAKERVWFIAQEFNKRDWL